MSNNKIAVFLSSLGDGGSQWVMIQIINFLSKYDLNIDLITLNNEGPYKNILIKTLI